MCIKIGFESFLFDFFVVLSANFSVRKIKQINNDQIWTLSERCVGLLNRTQALDISIYHFLYLGIFYFNVI